MNVAVINGSSRTDSQSKKVAEWMVMCLSGLLAGQGSVNMISMEGSPLPFWHEDMWSPGSAIREHWQGYADLLDSVDAFVVVTPEWNGMPPADLLNFFHFATTTGGLKYKPAMLVGVSDTMGGSYPVATLRQVVGKNSKLVILPDHVIVRWSKDALIGEDEPDEDEAKLRKRILYSLKALMAFSDAFRGVRDSGVLNDQEEGCRNGM